MKLRSNKPDTEFVTHLTGCQSRLYAYIRTLMAGSDSAADVLQETNLVLWAKADQFDPTRDFMPWAYTFAFNQVRAYRKKQLRNHMLFDDQMLAQIDASYRKRDLGLEDRLDALEGCMRKLPEQHQEMIRKRYEQRCSVNEMATEAGKAANSLYVMLHRIRKNLATCVEHTLAQEAVKEAGQPA